MQGKHPIPENDPIFQAELESLVLTLLARGPPFRPQNAHENHPQPQAALLLMDPNVRTHACCVATTSNGDVRAYVRWIARHDMDRILAFMANGLYVIPGGPEVQVDLQRLGYVMSNESPLFRFSTRDLQLVPVPARDLETISVFTLSQENISLYLQDVRGLGIDMRAVTEPESSVWVAYRYQQPAGCAVLSRSERVVFTFFAHGPESALALMWHAHFELQERGHMDLRISFARLNFDVRHILLRNGGRLFLSARWFRRRNQTPE